MWDAQRQPGWEGLFSESLLVFGLTQEARGWLRRHAGNAHCLLGLHVGHLAPGWTWLGDGVLGHGQGLPHWPMERAENSRGALCGHLQGP